MRERDLDRNRLTINLNFVACFLGSGDARVLSHYS